MERFEEKYRVLIRGTCPLLMNKFDDNKRTNTIIKSGSKDHNPIEEAEIALHKNKEGIICQPASHIESAMIRASTSYNMAGRGKKTYKDAFKGGIFVEPELIPHKNQKWEIDSRNVVIQRARIMRARPRFNEWELEFTIINIDERIRKEILKEILSDAGRHFGIGDYHPRFGRFEVIEFERIEKAA
jgi:hypothetical protein